MIYKQFPEPIVGALIFNSKREILLIRCEKWSNKYVIPGGHIEVGEAIENALRREVREETGIDIYDIEFIGFQESIFNEDFIEKKHFIFFDYACKTITCEVTLNSEAQEYIWVSLDKALTISVDILSIKAIEAYINNKM